jgi:NAD(P)-dependent dehydrogenase (short-subunit alcohol dehydrogenase family)
MSRVLFITGSGGGLGREIARAALARGDRVIATSKRTETLADLVAEYGDQILALAVQIEEPEAVTRTVQAGTSRFGRLDVVINVAGHTHIKAIEDLPMHTLHSEFATNFFGAVNVTKAALPPLGRQGSGHIVQVSLINSRAIDPGLGAYQAARRAVAGFSEVLAAEIGPKGISVTVAEPADGTSWLPDATANGSAVADEPALRPGAEQQVSASEPERLRAAQAIVALTARRPRVGRLAEVSV